jgi:hypothetical protein
MSISRLYGKEQSKTKTIRKTLMVLLDCDYKHFKAEWMAYLVLYDDLN